MSRIKHIEFWVSNLAVSLAFYEQIFSIIGWKKVDENGFSDGETKIYLIEQSVTLQKTLGPRHICFFSDSKEMVDEVATFLMSGNHSVIRGPVSATYLNRIYYTVDFHDPDGYVLEVATKSIVVE